MKLRAWITAAALVAGVAAPVAAAEGAMANTVHGRDAAAFHRALAAHPLRTLDGATLSTGGTVTVVNFWATWCKPCRHELPALDRLHREISPDGGRVIAVALDLDAGNVRRFVKANKLGLPVCVDGPDGLAKQLGLGEVPYTIVLDRRGEVAYSVAGTSDRELAELGAVVRRLASEERTALSEAAR